MFSSFSSISSLNSDDINTYLARYPKFVDSPRVTANVDFYSNRLRCRPDGEFIDDIHRKWMKEDAFPLLERHHGFIQWLFPIHQPGMNSDAKVLQKHEAAAIAGSEEMRNRVYKSYQIMINFYGFQIIDTATGQLGRTKLFKQRAANLMENTHNYLRITRILKSLGELGLEHLKLPMCLAFKRELSLGSYNRNLEKSATQYWFCLLRRSADRAIMDSADRVKGEVTQEWIRQALAERAEKERQDKAESDEKLAHEALAATGQGKNPLQGARGSEGESSVLSGQKRTAGSDWTDGRNESDGQDKNIRADSSSSSTTNNNPSSRPLSADKKRKAEEQEKKDQL